VDRSNSDGTLFTATYYEPSDAPNRREQNSTDLPLDDFEALLSARSRSDICPTLRDRIDERLQTEFSDELSKRATTLLLESQPELSAQSTLARWQRFGIVLTPILLIAGLIFLPSAVMTFCLCMVILYFVASAILKGALMVASLTNKQGKQTGVERELTPVVTLFLPVHKEDRAIETLVSELKKLDYPAEKLDVKFLTEANDFKTRDVLACLDLPQHFSVLKIPISDPQTKPKAMNYALPFARGEIIGIYDAEDAPEPDQIRKAVAALDAADNRTVCVQSRLNHFDATETFISRMASLEYTLWFDMLLRGLSNLKLPVPLGGTSLFIRTDALKAIDGWDPYNVTEDADLGVRLARKGWRAEVIDSTTWEEPPIGFKQWTGQRSRWIKGFMVTWLVHMRNPKLLFKQLGFGQALAINIMLLDGFVAFLLQPFFMLALGWWIITGSAPWFTSLTPPLATAIAATFIIGHLFIFIATVIAVTRRFGIIRALWSPLLWVYWQLATIPAYRALREMFGQQTVWRKTAHGLSKAAQQRRDKALQETRCAESACVTALAPSEPRHVRTNRSAKNWNGQPRLS